MNQLPRRWGKSTLYYCPVSKQVWQYDKDNKIYIHRDMPTYGLSRKELPR